MQIKTSIGFFLLLEIFLVFGCAFSKKDTTDDPIAIYSIINEDTTTGIDVVGLSGSNPMEVRKSIAKYEIPETTFEAKRKVFYTILDTLYKLKTSDRKKQGIYNTVDSLNYMGVHYLKNILTDKKSISNPLKHKLLKRVSSYDKAITVYSWEENLGVKMNANICVFQYISRNQPYSVFGGNDDEDEDFYFFICQIISLYKLSSESGNPLYLVNFMGNYERKNHFKGSMILEIRDKELFFDYDAFGGDTKYFFKNYTDGEILTTSFSYKSQELKYTFKTLNIIVETRFVFNGQIFERQVD